MSRRENVLVVRLDSAGDVLLAGPAIRGIAALPGRRDGRRHRGVLAKRDQLLASLVPR